MKRYTLSECQHLLALTNRQLDKLLLSASIDKQSLADASTDRRRKTLSQAQLDHLVQLQNDETITADSALLNRVAALEREVKRLAGLLSAPRGSVAPRVLPTSASVHRTTTGTIALRHAARLAARHGANSQDGARGWSIWANDANRSDESTTIAAIRAYLNSHMCGTWSLCDDAQCSCMTL
jgi:hypothetical protein